RAKMGALRISRRTLLLAPLTGAGCGRKKATGYPGYAFVANHEGRSVAVVDLTRFRVRKQIRLDAAPAVVVAHPRRPRVFVLAPPGGVVYESDGASLSVARSARVAASALGIQLAPALDALWVICRDPAEAIELPLDTMRPRRRLALPAPPDDFDISRAGDAAFACQATRSVAIAS